MKSGSKEQSAEHRKEKKWGNGKMRKTAAEKCVWQARVAQIVGKYADAFPHTHTTFARRHTQTHKHTHTHAPIHLHSQGK